MNKQIFYDPQRKRWKRLRRVIDILALSGFLLIAVFLVGLLRMKPLPELSLHVTKRNYRALANARTPIPRPGQKTRHSTHRKTNLKPSDVTLNSGEGLRAAYYVEWDPASYSSLKQHIKQIDLLFPEWIHVVTPEGNLTSFTTDNRAFRVVDNDGVHPVDQESKVARTIAANHVDMEVFPLVNNYDPVKSIFLPSIGDFLKAKPLEQPSSNKLIPSSPRTPTITESPSTSKKSPATRNPAITTWSPRCTTIFTQKIYASTSIPPSETTTSI